MVKGHKFWISKYVGRQLSEVFGDIFRGSVGRGRGSFLSFRRVPKSWLRKCFRIQSNSRGIRVFAIDVVSQEPRSLRIRCDLRFRPEAEVTEYDSGWCSNDGERVARHGKQDGEDASSEAG